MTECLKTSESLGDFGSFLSFASVPFGGRGPGFHRQAIGDAIKPTGKRSLFSDRGGFLGQDQKRRLIHILGIVPVMKNAAGGVEDHRPVAAEELRESPFIVLPDKLPQELLIRPPAHARIKPRSLRSCRRTVREACGPMIRPYLGDANSLYSARPNKKRGKIFVLIGRH